MWRILDWHAPDWLLVVYNSPESPQWPCGDRAGILVLHKILFSVYDRKSVLNEKRKETHPRFVFHSAFDLPHETPEEAENLPPRNSVEVRTVVVFDEEIQKEGAVINCEHNLKNSYGSAMDACGIGGC